jgi:hypothetical protein
MDAGGYIVVRADASVLQILGVNVLGGRVDRFTLPHWRFCGMSASPHKPKQTGQNRMGRFGEDALSLPSLLAGYLSASLAKLLVSMT